MKDVQHVVKVEVIVNIIVMNVKKIQTVIIYIILFIIKKANVFQTTKLLVILISMNLIILI